MDQEPLVTETINAGEEFAREFAAAYPIKALFWLKASDNENRYLYVASDRISDANILEAYREVLRLVNQTPSIFLDPFRIKLIKADDPLTRAAVDIQQRYRGKLATRFGGSTFGGMSVDDVYIYPPSVAVPAT